MQVQILSTALWHGRPSGLRRRTANPVFVGSNPTYVLLPHSSVVERLTLTQKVAGSSPAAVVQGFSVMAAHRVLIPYE